MNGELISCNCTHTLIYTTFKNQFLQVRSFEISTSLPSAALQTSHLVLKLAEKPRSVMPVRAHRGACSSRAVCTSPRRQSGSHVTVISVFLMDLTQGRGHSLVSPSSTPLIWSRVVGVFPPSTCVLETQRLSGGNRMLCSETGPLFWKVTSGALRAYNALNSNRHRLAEPF